MIGGQHRRAASERGFRLEPGRGSDADTAGLMTVYVMDSDEFPPYRAEFYHQFNAVSAGVELLPRERPNCPDGLYSPSPKIFGV